MNREFIAKFRTLTLLSCLSRCSKKAISLVGAALNPRAIRLQQLRLLITCSLLASTSATRRTLVVDLPGEPLRMRLNDRLPVHVGDQVLDGFLGLVAEGLAAEVNGYEGTGLHQRVRQKHLQEQAQLLAALLQERCLHIADVLLLWEGWRAISALNLALDH